MMMMISTRSRFTRTDDESVRRFLPLENGRRDVFGLVSLLLLLERGGGFFRRFVAITAASVAARRCHVSLSLVDEDGFDGRKKSEEEKEEEKKQLRSKRLFESRNTTTYNMRDEPLININKRLDETEKREQKKRRETLTNTTSDDHVAPRRRRHRRWTWAPSHLNVQKVDFLWSIKRAG